MIRWHSLGVLPLLLTTLPRPDRPPGAAQAPATPGSCGFWESTTAESLADWLAVDGALGRLVAPPPLARNDGSLWYVSPVYLEGDANCCPSSGVRLWLEARPRQGRFETGLLLRSHEDSNGTVLGVDTIP